MKRLLPVTGLFLTLACFAPAAIFAQEAGTKKEAVEKEEPQPPMEYKWVNFAILALALGYGIVAKGMPALTERGHDIEKALKAAEQIKADAAAEEAAIDRKMAGLRAEIEALRAAAKREMEAEGQRLKAETAALVAKLQANAESEVATMTKQAQQALSARASELALNLARQKAAAQMNASTDAGLINGFVADLKQMQEARN